ncbi:ATP-dependent helicase/nuclease subunit A [Melghirimyces profundicolus]|uniref:DNA 3'-5' helicase n=1 Tax=Melghirimyces profundicolus TaxID=1242148 RepID=A0A2T6C824_9BACL|nr:UvrD-helicase domain-containing protein [Melghirimyces profundicolus]PTX64426.1 ATP-dependent helicase/nuclease subunit A [Melghirimyces profundicolus]
MSLRMTPDQTRAVESLDTDCIVSAGAGSGKTRVLVERFLRILEEHGEDPDILERIVAITFTEKAATEMKDRVRQGLKDRLENARKRDDTEAADRWYRLLTEAERTRITTIHSFCTRLLRDFPVEAGVDPGFSVMDETEAGMLLRETVEASLPRVTELPDPGRTHLEQWISHWGVEGCIPWVMEACHRMAGNGWDPGDLLHRTRSHLHLTAGKLQAEWRERREALLMLADPLMHLKGGKKLQTFQRDWPGLSLEILEAGNPADLISPLEELGKLLQGNWGKKTEITAPRDRLKEEVQELLNVATGLTLMPVEREMSEAMGSLLAEVHQRYVRAKRERSALDFDDLQTRAIHLLRDHPKVLDRVRDSIRFLMVDEFQDTNDGQKKLVDLLCGDPASSPPGKLFVVGDPKQSIYRFRGAEVRVFGETREEIRSRGGREVNLVDNFRSDPALVDFVNLLFGRLMSGDPTSPNHYRETVANREPKDGLRVEYLPVPDSKACPEGKDPRDVEAERVARRIRQLLDEGTPPGEIAVLFQAMTHVKRYEKALVRRGIPFYVVKGRGFYDRQEVVDVLHYLRFLADPGDLLSLTGVLRSPFCGVSDGTILALTREPGWEQSPGRWPEIEGIREGERQKLAGFADQLARARRWAGRLPVAELIERLLESSGYRHVLWATPQGKQARANLDKLVHLARGQKHQGGSIETFLQSVEEWQTVQQETEAAVEPEDGNSVKLMTIHQSKGLEFPVVFVPDLSRSPNVNQSDVTVDREFGLVLLLRGIAGVRGEPFRWRKWKEREQRLEREESVRLFYVAATRAEHRLILSGVPQEHKGGKKGEPILSADTWSKWLDGVFGFDRIDWERENWDLGEKEVVLRVHPREEEEGDPKPPEAASPLASGWFEQPEAVSPEESPAREAATAMEPRGWQPVDRPEISVTDIMTLVNCPRKYFYSRILGISFPAGWTEEPEEELRDEEESFLLTPQRKGEMVHRMIEECPPSFGDESLEDFWERMMDLFRVNPSVRTEVRRELQPLFEAYRNSRFHRDAHRYSQVEREARFVRVLADLEVEGVVDRLHCTPDGSWELVDYKTNGIRAEEVEATAREYLPQMQLYVLAAREKWGRQVSRATLFFLHPGKEFSWEVDDEWVRQAEEHLAETSRLFLRGQGIEDYSPRPGKRCGYCEFRHFCGAAGN